MHGEITSEKMAMGYLFDGKATMVVGTHTHVPTSDHRIMDKGTLSNRPGNVQIIILLLV